LAKRHSDSGQVMRYSEQIILPHVDTSFITISNHQKNGTAWFPGGCHNQPPISAQPEKSICENMQMLVPDLLSLIREYRFSKVFRPHRLYIREDAITMAFGLYGVKRA